MFACTLSSKISRLFLTDPTVNKYNINANINSSNTILLLLDLIKNGFLNCETDYNDIIDLYHIGIDIDCPDMIAQYKIYLNTLNICIENLHVFLDYASITHDFTCIQDYIQSNFNDIPDEKLKEIFLKLGIDFAHVIFSKQNAHTKIAKILMLLIPNDENFAELIQYLDLRIVGTTIIQQFTTFIENSSPRVQRFALLRYHQYFTNRDHRNEIEALVNNLDSLIQYLTNCVKDGDMDIIKWFISNEYDKILYHEDHNILLESAYKNNFLIAKSLVDNGSNSRVVAEDNTNCLMFFAQSENLEAVKYFAQFLDVDAEDDNGYTAMDMCNENAEIISFLQHFKDQ